MKSLAKKWFMPLSIRQHLVLVGFMLILLGLGWLYYLASPSSNAHFISQWRTSDATDNWQQGHQANLGQSDEQLLFNLQFTQPGSAQHLVVAPPYLDVVDVLFYDVTGRMIANTIKGDRTLDLTLEHSFDIDQLVFSVPDKAVSANISILATESLQANISLLSKPELIWHTYFGLISISTAMGLIVLAALAGGLVYWWNGELLYGVFAIHQTAWFLLLLAFSYFIPSLISSAVYFNSHLLGAATITTTITGVTFHWQLLRNLVKARWLNKAFVLTIMVSLFNLGMYIFADQRQSLMNNAITLVVATMTFIIAIPLAPRKNHMQRLILRKVMWIYIILLLFVVFATVSRLGFGNGSLLPFAYLFALISMLLLGYMLLINSAVQRRQKANALAKSRLLTAKNNQLNHHIEEQSALLSMLSHEITPPSPP